MHKHSHPQVTPDRRIRPHRPDAPRARVGAIIIALALGACSSASHGPVAQTDAAGPPAIVFHEEPPPLDEVRPPRPANDFDWVPGHWDWGEHGWLWTSGSYVQRHVPPMPAPLPDRITEPPGPGYAWIRGHWRWIGDAWSWQPGRWVSR